MMNKKLQQKLINLPLKPGVYTFLNESGKILYIGKAKNLKNRVRSYFAKSNDLTPAKLRMVAQITDIEYTMVDNETEALLLETTLIKEHKPPYNVILKDDKYWQYLVLDFSNTWPQIYATRRPNLKQKKNMQYFGPYTSGYAVKETLKLIKKIFPVCLKLPKGSHPELISGSNSKEKQTLKQVQSDKRGCFNYHLGRCLGPCVGKTTPNEYSSFFDDIKKFITGSQTELTKKLKTKMLEFSQTKHFEAAGRTRDQIKALQKLQGKQKVVLNNQANIDIISLYKFSDKAAINLFKVRQGKLLDKFNSLVKSPETNDEEILESFIEQYYTATTDLPQLIFSHSKLNLNKIFNTPIKQTIRGKKKQLATMGILNAKEFLSQQETFFDRESKKQQAALDELQKILKLPKFPRRIETYDISNIQGQFAVGSMVVFEDAKPKKSDYRRFKIRLKMTPDDPAMMREILDRRLKYLISNHPKSISHPEFSSGSNRKKRQILKQVQDDSFIKTPDLIVIDGGITQLNSVLEIMRELEINIPVIGLAKKQEEIYVEEKKQTIKLSKRSLALQLLQQGRDEAHRFAISHYRVRHTKKAFSSILDEIPGLGPKTKQLISKKFKTIKELKNASQEELSKILGPKKAKLIKDNL